MRGTGGGKRRCSVLVVCRPEKACSTNCSGSTSNALGRGSAVWKYSAQVAQFNMVGVT